MNLEDKIESKIERELDTMSWGKLFGWFVGICCIGLIMVAVSGVFSTVGTVATSPGRVISKTMQTANIIQSYEWFYDINASYQAKTGQIRQFKEFYSSETDKKEKSRLRIDMAAIQQMCRNLTEKYNANSQKMNKSVFKGWSLPDLLNQSTCE